MRQGRHTLSPALLCKLRNVLCIHVDLDGIITYAVICKVAAQLLIACKNFHMLSLDGSIKSIGQVRPL
jgi:hypothetical protein